MRGPVSLAVPGKAWTGAVHTQHSPTWPGTCGSAPGPSAPLWSCPRAGPRWKQVRRVPAQPLAGLSPRRLPGWAPCHTAVLRSTWPRALGAACPLLATQSVLTPPGPAGRGQEGDEQGAGLRLGGCLRRPRDWEAPGQARQVEGREARAGVRRTGHEVSSGPDLGFGWGAPGCGGERTR